MEKTAKKAINKSRENIGMTKGKPSKSTKNETKKPTEKEEKKVAKDGDEEMAEEGIDKSDGEDKSDDESEAEEVSFEAKVQFTEKVRRLTNDGLTRLVKMVKSKCKDALEDVDSEKLHI